MSLSRARERLLALPTVELGVLPSPIDFAWRLRDDIGMGARLVIKRDDAIPFGFGGNKIRKLTVVAADAVEQRADTLITCGGVQSNHARATAAAAARLGLRCELVANGVPQPQPTGNARLVAMLGANLTYVGDRTERIPAMESIAQREAAAGRRAVVIPLGASTPLGAMGIALGIGEIVRQGIVPDVIVHSSSSGGTQAGLIAGCALFETRTRVIGVSADEPVDGLHRVVMEICSGIEDRLGLSNGALSADARFEADAGQIGDGYGIPTDASREAQSMAARNEALFTDHWYSAKALAALVGYGRSGRFVDGETVMFWHTGGQVGLLA